MPKIIFTSRYIKNKSAKKLSHLVHYIATREGTEAFDPTRNYMDYLDNRPGSHGLWNGGDEKIMLSQAMDEVANHRGNLWTHVVSLRRADAARMGYDNAEAWRELVKSKIPVIADAMKIPLDDLRWYGAYHNRANNPHIHLIVFSQNPSHGYLTEPGIEKMRSAFATEIYKNELMYIYEQKDSARARVNEFADSRMRELAAQLQNGGCDSAITEMLSALSARLKKSSGKKQYGYLKPEVKAMADAIVAKLADDPRIAEMYRHWYELTAEVKRVYTSDIPEPPPLSRENTFKTIKNMVIRYALGLGEPAPSMEAEQLPDDISIPDTEPTLDGSAAPAPDEQDADRNDSGFSRSVPALLRALSQMIQVDYQAKRKNYEQAVDSKLMQKIRRKKQDLGQKME